MPLAATGLPQHDISTSGIEYFNTRHIAPSGSLGVDAGRRWRDLPSADLYAQGMGFEQDVEFLYRQIRDAIPAEADGVLIAGTGLRCVGIINTLERDIKRPVITANQASLWHCLRMTGISSAISGYGRLLEFV